MNSTVYTNSVTIISSNSNNHNHNNSANINNITITSNSNLNNINNLPPSTPVVSNHTTNTPITTTSSDTTVLTAAAGGDAANVPLMTNNISNKNIAALDDQEALLQRAADEREAIFNRYSLGLDPKNVVDPWENPTFELYHITDK